MLQIPLCIWSPFLEKPTMEELHHQSRNLVGVSSDVDFLLLSYLQMDIEPSGGWWLESRGESRVSYHKFIRRSEIDRRSEMECSKERSQWTGERGGTPAEDVRMVFVCLRITGWLVQWVVHPQQRSKMNESYLIVDLAQDKIWMENTVCNS